MRRPNAFSARGFAVAAVFCALSIGSGCGRETFDLLQTAGAPTVSGAAGAAGAANGGASAGGSAGSGGSGAGGKGSAGHASFPPDAGGGGQCAPGEPCADGGVACPVSVPFCIPCSYSKECPGDAPYCDPNLGRCIQCRRDNDCAQGQACNIFTQRCGRICKTSDDCAADDYHLVCHTGIGVCVSCIATGDCLLYGHSDYKCDFNTCVECIENRQCASQLCVAGRCQRH